MGLSRFDHRLTSKLLVWRCSRASDAFAPGNNAANAAERTRFQGQRTPNAQPAVEAGNHRLRILSAKEKELLERSASSSTRWRSFAPVVYAGVLGA